MVKLAVAEDIPVINAILNCPDIYRWATMGKPVGPLDVTHAFNQLFTLLVDNGESGCIILDPYSESTMEVHVCLMPACQGHESEEVVKDTLRFVFAETGAMEILTKVPKDHKAADLFTRQVGFVRISDSDDLRAYQFSIERWPYLDESLTEFCPPELAIEIIDHHQQRVMGAFMLMSLKGFMGKAVSIYNKHARLHGFAPMQIIGMDSVLVGGQAIHFGVNTYRVEVKCPRLTSTFESLSR
jgi:hypothetical protein